MDDCDAAKSPSVGNQIANKDCTDIDNKGLCWEAESEVVLKQFGQKKNHTFWGFHKIENELLK